MFTFCRIVILSAQWKPGYHRPACQGPLHRRRNFTKDQALQAWRGSRAWRGLDRDSLEKGSRQGLGEASGLAKAFASPRALCLCDRAHMGSASAAESRTRQSVMTPALSLLFACIKQSTKQRQAKEQQGIGRAHV